MAKVFIEETTLSSIGDAIRNKAGTSELIAPLDMPAAIDAIESGGGGADIPEEAFTITGDCSGMFSNDKWKWFFDAYQNKIKFENILTSSELFSNSSYEKVKVHINLAETGTQNGISSIFLGMFNLKELDFKISGKITSPNISQLFQNCRNLRYIENPFENLDMSLMYTNTGGQQQNWFYSCYSLREVDRSFWDNVIISRTSSYGHLYSYTYGYCYCLDEAYLPITTGKNYDSNAFSDYTFYGISRAKSVLFQTNTDNTPLVVNWRNQTINLSQYVGWANSISNILNYNSGITTDKRITNAATYEALKNDADWWASDIAYSRYNHDSAVNTINSLPDTSAYLASAGGTNTIKFKGASGSATDGGAINTLTEEEIAVAAAKGWTVSFA